MEVARLGNIGNDVVELRRRRLDQLPAARDQRAQGRPAIGVERNARLGVHRSIVFATRTAGAVGGLGSHAAQPLGETLAVDRRRAILDAEQRQRGGEEVGLTHRLRDARPGRTPAPATIHGTRKVDS